MSNGIKLQNKEFDALDNLIKKYKMLECVAVVDDDYPRVRHCYENALNLFIEACKNNGRLG